MADNFSRLIELQKEHAVVWTLGSGEMQNKVFAGIAHVPHSGRWKEIERWFFSDELTEVLSQMVEMAELDINKNASTTLSN